MPACLGSTDGVSMTGDRSTPSARSNSGTASSSRLIAAQMGSAAPTLGDWDHIYTLPYRPEA
jgi:hypothetical protein